MAWASSSASTVADELTQTRPCGLAALGIGPRLIAQMVVFGLAQLVQLWLNALTGSRPPTLAFVLPALVSALLWPWICAILRGLHLRLNVN